MGGTFTDEKITDPSTGWKASQTSGWTADSFSGGLTVTFDVPRGTKRVACVVRIATTASLCYWRENGDTNISNTPNASNEHSHIIGDAIGYYQIEVQLLGDGVPPYVLNPGFAAGLHKG